MHRIIRRLKTGHVAERDFADERLAESCFNATLMRDDVARVLWYQGEPWNAERKLGGWRLVKFGGDWRALTKTEH